MYNYLTSKLVNVLITGTLLLGVLATNSLVAFVWLSPSNRTPVSILLSIIAFHDTLTIIFGASNVIASYIGGSLLSVKACYVVMTTSTLAFVFHSQSILSTTYLAIQRCVICAFPFLGPRVFGLKTTTICVIVSFVSMMALKMPDLLFYDIGGIIHTFDDNTTALNCKVNYILNDETVLELPEIYMYIRFFALHLVPGCIVSFCMVVCLITVNRKTMATSQSSDQQRIRTRTTLMLVLIMFVFILGELPTTISVFHRAFFPGQPIWLTTSTGNWFCNITLVTSYTVNIWVYIAMSKGFRQSLSMMLCSPSRTVTSNNSNTA
ncbi:unnamed protein product [Mytilus coruscus]|uniref:G-protein coupled receptors family 1 profile domain-containing protein n=1 Tax=Mytilus coruscus TaxID=42192 RepID=A0A6J8D0F0_MYTCO|nr:unnamed protein product [Mytilus coruscus]